MQEIKANKNDDLTYTVGTITLKQDVNTPSKGAYLMFKYATTADVSDAVAGSNDYKNTISVNNKKVDAVYTYKKGSITKTDENNVTDTTQKMNEDGTLTWKIKVDTVKDTNKLTITDNLPDGVTLEKVTGENKLANLSAAVSDEKVTGTVGSDYSVSGSYKNNKLELVIESNDDHKLLETGQYILVVTCKVNKDAIKDYEGGKHYTFKNEASASDDKGKIGSADQTQEWSEDTEHSNAKVVDKEGNWDNNNRRIKYSIKLNPYGKDIVKGAETLTLKDIFDYNETVYAREETDYTGMGESFDANAWLVPDSVKLYEGVPDGKGGLTKGKEITDWNWTVETSRDEYPTGGVYKRHSTLTGKNLSDSTPMILEYDYQMQTNIPEGWKSNGSLTVSNKAELLGTDYKDDKEQNDVNWGKQDSSDGFCVVRDNRQRTFRRWRR